MRYFRHGFIGMVFLVIGWLFVWQPLPAQAQGAAPATGKPALYEFGAGYCASCKDMAKVMAELTTTHSDQVEFRMVYVDKDKPLFEQYKIMLIPTQVFLDASGKEVDRHIGPLTKEEVLKKLTQTPGVKNKLTPLGREKMLQATLGLTASQAQRVFAKAIVTDGVLDDRDIDLVTEEKKQIIRESEALEFFSVTETPDDVGGLGVLKEWLRLRERAFTQDARNYGLPAPKGIALIAIPGTGKSLTAKMIGGLWRIPLLRLDVGALFGSLVGESEERARRALRLAEGCSVVEMEAAAFFAVAEFRRVELGQLVYGGDLVVPGGWDGRAWHKRSDDRRLMFELAADALRELLVLEERGA